MISSVFVLSMVTWAWGQATSTTNAGCSRVFDPTIIAPSPAAILGGVDPTADINFMTCQAVANVPPPPDMSDLNASNPLAAMSSVLGGATGGMAGALSGGGASAVGNGILGGLNGLGGSCSAPISDPNRGTTCDDYKISGKFSESQLQEAIQAYQSARQKAKCQAYNAERAANIIDCFDRNINTIRNAMKKVKKDFDDVMSGFNNYETCTRGEIQKASQNSQALEKKIAQFKSAQDQIEPVLKALNSAAAPGGKDSNTLAGLQQRLHDQENLQLAFQKSVVSAKNQRTVSCLRGSGATTSRLRGACKDKDSNNLHPYDCLLRTYAESAVRSSTGGVNPSRNADLKVEGDAEKDFSQSLDLMLADWYGQNPLISSMAQFKAKYQTQLNAYGPAGAQMLVELEQCNTEANAAVDAEIAGKTYGLGEKAEANNTAAGQLSSEIGAQLDQLNGPARTTLTQLYGREPSEMFSLAKCHQVSTKDNNGNVVITTVSLQNQLACLQTTAALMRAVIDGDIPPGTPVPPQFPLNIPGSNGQQMTCQGIRPCMEQASLIKGKFDKAVEDMQGDTTYQSTACGGTTCPGLKNFHRTANANMREAYNIAAGKFAYQLNNATARLAQIESSLGAVGLDFPKKETSLTDLDQICPISDTEICKPPADIDKVLLGQSGFSVPDEGSIQEAKEKARNKGIDATKQASDFASVVNLKLNPLMTTCKKEERDKAGKAGVGKVVNAYDDALSACKDYAGQFGIVEPNISSTALELKDSLKLVCDGAKGDVPEDCGPITRKIRDLPLLCSKEAEAVADSKAQRAFYNSALPAALKPH